MSREAAAEAVTPALLRSWRLPEPHGSKYGRGQVLVVGGARATPGAAMLAGLAALRVGAGRLSLAVAGSVAPAVAVAVPEAGVSGLAEDDDGEVRGDDAQRLERHADRADAVLVGPGLGAPEGTLVLLRSLVPQVGDDVPVVLDAFALGVLRGAEDVQERLRGRLVLTPNLVEMTRLLGRDEISDEETADAVTEVAERFGAVVCGQGFVSDGGRTWRSSTGHTGLGTSGSGDVLAGAIVGLLARGADAAQACVWAMHLHAAAGDALTARVGKVGFLARELVDELPHQLHALSA